MFFMVPSWFLRSQVGFHGFSWFQAGFSCFFMVPGWIFIVPGWFFMVPGVFYGFSWF